LVSRISRDLAGNQANTGMVMSWLQDHGWVVGVIVAAALALAGLAWWAARRPPPVPGAAARRQADLTFAAAVLVTLAVGLAAVLWLLGQADQVSAGKDRATAQADAVKTGATIALGTGGAAYLLLAYRRQRLAAETVGIRAIFVSG
jgi:cytochrome b561